MEVMMSIKFERPIVPAIGLSMINGRTRLIGIPKDKVQVVMTLPDIKEFNDALSEAIEFFKDRADAFIITSSSQEECEEIISKYELSESLISKEFKDFGKTFNMIDENKQLKKSLMIIDTNCQITHKDIL
jgi:thiol peroxidase